MKYELDALYQEFGLIPVMAAEIECYVLLADDAPHSIDKFWEPIEKAFDQHGLPILRIECERGYNQFEVVTGVMPADRLVNCLQQIRAIIERYAARTNTQVSFAGKPYSDQPSSGLHIHVHLADGEGINSYHKTEEWTSDTLRHSLGGLLALMAQQMPIYFPDINDYARLNDVDHVPKIFGWGVNNRYCALRIPAHPDMYDKRIEHRVACANADPALVVHSLLAGVLYGLRERIEPPEQQYGKWGTTAFQQALAPVREDEPRGEPIVNELALASVGEGAHIEAEWPDFGT